jgi:hypothetical protein
MDLVENLIARHVAVYLTVAVAVGKGVELGFHIIRGEITISVLRAEDASLAAEIVKQLALGKKEQVFLNITAGQPEPKDVSTAASLGTELNKYNKVPRGDPPA